MSVTGDAWTNAEQACYNYMLSALNGVDATTPGNDGDAYLGAIPNAVIGSKSYNHAWEFSFIGSEAEQMMQLIPHNGRAGQITTWWVHAAFRGIYSARADCISTYGKVQDVLPAGKNHPSHPLDYVQTFRISRIDIHSEWFPMTNTEEKIRMWICEAAFIAVFDPAQ